MDEFIWELEQIKIFLYRVRRESHSPLQGDESDESDIDWLPIKNRSKEETRWKQLLSVWSRNCHL